MAQSVPLYSCVNMQCMHPALSWPGPGGTHLGSGGASLSEVLQKEETPLGALAIFLGKRVRGGVKLSSLGLDPGPPTYL